MVKVAFIGLHHWHAPFYMKAMKDMGYPIAAVADRDASMAEFRARAGECTAPQYTDYERLLREVKPDLVFAHAPHDEMTALADWLVEHRVPFHMEKPMGISAEGLAAVAAKASQAGLWNAVALVSRQYAIVRRLREMGDEMGTLQRYYYALLAGPPVRYPEWRCEWMLQPERAGAGPLWNFGAHVIDLFLLLGKSPVVEVTANWTHDIHHLPVEDLCTMRLRNQRGVVGVGEISYTTPNGYERFFSVSTDRLQVHTDKLGKGTIKKFGSANEAIDGTEFDDVYPFQTKDIIDSFAAGRKPVADIHDMVATLRVMEAARRSASAGGTPVAVTAC
ncbi:MAG: Gfo/Idh/MocA family oxidoreductase [Lentisphaerae bacterium]|nr:Gfo/Idh/MocA family oxidoreductase [Lentisphaerota bacterium]